MEPVVRRVGAGSVHLACSARRRSHTHPCRQHCRHRHTHTPSTGSARRARRTRPRPQRCARSRSALRAARWQAARPPSARTIACLDRVSTSADESHVSGLMTTEASYEVAQTRCMDQFCTSVTPKLTSSRSRGRVDPPVQSPFVFNMNFVSFIVILKNYYVQRKKWIKRV